MTTKTLNDRLNQVIYEYCRDFPEVTLEEVVNQMIDAQTDAPVIYETAMAVNADDDDTRCDERREGVA